jgi:hypothetical protein
LPTPGNYDKMLRQEDKIRSVSYLFHADKIEIRLLGFTTGATRHAYLSFPR